MAEYNKKCPTCKELFIAKRKDKSFCSRICYRRSPGIKERYRARNDKNRDKNKYKPKWRHQRLKTNCKRRKLDLKINLEQYEHFLSKNCHYCDKNISKETGSGLDRIDNNKGYLIDNVVTCCGACNQVRNVHLSKEEMEVAMEAVIKLRKQYNSETSD